MLVYMLVVLML